MLLPALALCCTLVVYAPILQNYFASDDFLHMYDIANYPLAHFLLQPFGGHVYLVRNTIFVLTYRLFGPVPFPFLAIVLLTHLVNVLLLYRLLRLVTGSAPLACGGATLWGMCPLAEGAIGWYSVYGHVLVATILLVVLNQVAVLRVSGAPVTTARAVGWSVLWLVATTCFGVGLALGAAFPLVVWLLLPGRLAGRARTVLWLLPFGVLGLYATLEAVYYRWVVDGAPDVERALLLATPYWRLTTSMLGHLLIVGVSAPILGFTHALSSYPDPTSFAVAGVVAAGAGLVLVASPATERRALLAWLVLALAAYALVALGRAPFFARMPMAKAALQSRYHYAASIPLVVVVCTVLAQLGARLGRRLPATPLALAWIALLLVAWGRSAPPIDHHDADRQATAEMLDAVRAAVVAAPPGSDVFIPNRRFLQVGLGMQRFPGWGALFTVFFPDDRVDGRRVRFVAEDANQFASLPAGTRVAALFVPPGAAPEVRDGG